MANATMLIINIIELFLSVVSIVGVVYLTKFAFTKMTGTTVCLTTTKNKMTIAKVAVVLLWLQIGFGVLAALTGIMNRKGGSMSAFSPMGSAFKSAFR